MLSGIYAIMCLGNGKYYIGSSINIKARFAKHKGLLRKNKHYNAYLQNSWNEYGERMFIFSVLEEIADGSQLLVEEQKWLDATLCYKPQIGFNESPTASNTTGYKHSEEHIKSKSHKWIVTNVNTKEVTEVTNLKEFCRKHNLGNGTHLYRIGQGKADSYKGLHCRSASISMEEWRLLRSNHTRSTDEWQNSKSWLCTDSAGNEHQIKNLERFCREHHLSVDVMRRVANGGRNKSHHGWRVKRATE